MTAQTAEKIDHAQPDMSQGEVAVFQKPRLPWHDAIAQRFGELGVDKSTWKALVEAVFPLAQSADAVVMALSYCKARNLDPFKRVVHIVPMWNGQLRKSVDTVWPGIAELRTTAARTGQYAGKSEPEFGPDTTDKIGDVNMTFPEWCKVTVYRLVGGHRAPFTGMVFWREAVVMRRDKKSGTTAPNDMWTKRTRGQLAKCAEAEALREAFPEEIGGDLIPEEMAGGEVHGDLVAGADGVYQAAPSEKPTRNESAEPFVLTDLDGEVHQFSDPKDFVETALVDLEAAVEAGEFAAQWETNINEPDVLGRLDRLGATELVVQLNEQGAVLRGMAEEAAERAARPEHLGIDLKVYPGEEGADWQRYMEDAIALATEATDAALLDRLETHPSMATAEKENPTVHGFIAKAIAKRRKEL